MSIKIQKHIRLNKFTTFGIGGPADYFCVVQNEKELIEALNWADHKELPYFILGSGSNLLVSDHGMKGLVIKLNNKDYQIDNRLVVADSGLRWGELVQICKQNSLSGLEFTIGIPGSVGGGVVMNCGVKDREIKDVLKRVKIYDQNKESYWLNKKDCEFGYRRSRFSKTKEIILKAEFKLSKKDPKLIQKNIKKHLHTRKKQPPGLSAGSIFKNPQGDYAGRLIEKTGLKGKQIGDVKVSEEHANFIINNGEGKAADVIELINLIKKAVKNKFSLELEKEIKIVGRF